MMKKKLRNDRRKAIALDLLMAAEHVQRPRAAQALRIARRLVCGSQPANPATNPKESQ